MTDPVALDDLGRAITTFKGLRSPKLFSKHRDLFGVRSWLLWRRYQPLWPYANAWSATATLAASRQPEEARRALPGFTKGLYAYRRQPAASSENEESMGFESVVVPPLGSGGDAFYDDNAWIGLALCRHHELTGDPQLATLSRRVLSFIVSGWSNDTEWAKPGGIRWKVPPSNTSRNTCSNGPTAALAALIHLRDGDEASLSWAKRIYSWVRGALLGTDNLYVDRIDPRGELEPTCWTYNQGSMIGAGVLLHRVTHEPVYLADAQATAQAAMSRFTLSALMSQGPAFNAIFFRNLLLLDQVAPDPTRRELAKAYGDEMWKAQRDEKTKLFQDSGSFLNNAAPMVAIHALLAGSPPYP